MKKILLAKKWKRLIARFIDLTIVISLTFIIFLIFVFPNTLDNNKLKENGNKISELYLQTDLFLVDDNGNYCAKCGFNNVTKLEDLYNIKCSFSGKTYENISLTQTLYNYYTTQYKNFGGQTNLSLEVYKRDILKLGGEESNIKDFNIDTYTLELIDNEKSNATVSFFLNIYEDACVDIIKNSEINTLTTENQQIFMSSFVWIIPVLFAVSAIFDLLIPMVSPSGESIGKYIFKLGVISNEGYKLKKYKYIIRWLVYVSIELLLGILSFGAAALISYTMFLFSKNRRCIHDFIASSVVIDKEHSIYFSSAKEESFYINRQNERGL